MLKTFILSLLLTSLFLPGCNSSPTTPKPIRQEKIQVDEILTLYPDWYRYYGLEAKAGDTLKLEITLTQGDSIPLIFIADEQHFHYWEDDKPWASILCEENTTGGKWTVRILTDDIYYTVISNRDSQDTLKISVKLTQIRWF